MPTLYEEIDGDKIIPKLVATFYQRVLSDPLLSPFFENTAIEKLEKMQIAFFTIALGGPEPEMKISLTEAHKDKGIQTAHLTRFTELLVETLSEIGIEQQDAQKVYERIATYSDEVLGETSADG